MAKVVLLVTLLAGSLHLGQSLRCVKCNGCESSRPTQETCRNVDANIQQAACLTQVVRVTQSNEPMTVKKCAILDKNVQYKCPDLPDTIAMRCDVCVSGDMCNTAGSVRKVTLSGLAAAVLFSIGLRFLSL